MNSGKIELLAEGLCGYDVRIDGQTHFACNDGFKRFLAAHPNGQGDIYSVWINERSAGVDVFHSDVYWLARRTHNIIYNAVISSGWTYRRCTFVNCHIADNECRLSGTFIGCTFAKKAVFKKNATVIE